MASLVPVDPDLGPEEAPWLDELHLLLVLSFIGLMWLLKITLHLPGLLGLLRKPGPQRRDPGGGDRAGTGHDGALRALSHLAAPPCTELGGEGNHQDVLIMRAALSAKNAKDKDPGPYAPSW